jgi:hypothetical protein
MGNVTEPETAVPGSGRFTWSGTQHLDCWIRVRRAVEGHQTEVFKEETWQSEGPFSSSTLPREEHTADFYNLPLQTQELMAAPVPLTEGALVQSCTGLSLSHLCHTASKETSLPACTERNGTWEGGGICPRSREGWHQCLSPFCPVFRCVLCGHLDHTFCATGSCHPNSALSGRPSEIYLRASGDHQGTGSQRQVLSVPHRTAGLSPDQNGTEQ